MLTLYEKKFSSRFLLGTAQYPSPDILLEAINASKAEVITMSIRRQNFQTTTNEFWELLKNTNSHILPNTAGCYSAKEALNTAKMAREIFETNWIKLEVIGDDYTLLPNPLELIKATELLQDEGFDIFPYCTDDLIVCNELVNIGCKVLMPLASPIGSAQGILNPYALGLLRERFSDISIIVDAGIGKPSHAAQAMELGADGILLNSAVALSNDPANMALAFSKAIDAGHLGYLSGMIPASNVAKATTPLIGKPFWQGVEND